MEEVITLDYELYHYGVKGMKWGVRKDRYVNSKQKAMIDHSKKNHPSIPKGTTVYRTTHGESDNLSSDIYVSWTDRDRNYYRKNWGTNLGEEVAMRKVINDGKNFKSYKYNLSRHKVRKKLYLSSFMNYFSYITILLTCINIVL